MVDIHVNSFFRKYETFPKSTCTLLRCISKKGDGPEQHVVGQQRLIYNWWAIYATPLPEQSRSAQNGKHSFLANVTLMVKIMINDQHFIFSVPVKIGDRGCTEDYHCNGGALCDRRTGRCLCPEGYNVDADKKQCLEVKGGCRNQK